VSEHYGERIELTDMLTLEGRDGGQVALELKIGTQVIVTFLRAHEVHRLAALITRASLESLHRIVVPAQYDLVYTLSARATSHNMDVAGLLGAIHEETVAKPARAALEHARTRRKGDADAM
jgi:hypothetical protein